MTNIFSLWGTKQGLYKLYYHNNRFCSLILVFGIVRSFFFFSLYFPRDGIIFSLAKLIKFLKCLLYTVFSFLFVHSFDK